MASVIVLKLIPTPKTKLTLSGESVFGACHQDVCSMAEQVDFPCGEFRRLNVTLNLECCFSILSVAVVEQLFVMEGTSCTWGLLGIDGTNC